MPITIEAARRELQRFRVSSRIQNLFAQAHAKRVLLDVGELAQNFPRFDDDLDDRVTWSAYEIIAAACTIAEQDQQADATTALHLGAELLEHLHRTRAKHRGGAPAFHVLVAAMAFYAAGQYSRAFVAMRAAEEQTICAEIIGAFLRRDVRRAVERATSAVQSLTSAGPESSQSAETLGVETGVTLGVARAVHLALEYAHGGDRAQLYAAEACAADAMTIAAWGRSPAWWFVTRLLRLMLRDLGESSLWAQLPPYYPPSASDDLARYSPDVGT